MSLEASSSTGCMGSCFLPGGWLYSTFYGPKNAETSEKEAEQAAARDRALKISLLVPPLLIAGAALIAAITLLALSMPYWAAGAAGIGVVLSIGYLVAISCLFQQTEPEHSKIYFLSDWSDQQAEGLIQEIQQNPACESVVFSGGLFSSSLLEAIDAIPESESFQNLSGEADQPFSLQKEHKGALRKAAENLAFPAEKKVCMDDFLKFLQKLNVETIDWNICLKNDAFQELFLPQVSGSAEEPAIVSVDIAQFAACIQKLPAHVTKIELDSKMTSYLPIRKALIDAKFTFRSNSDCEDVWVRFPSSENLT